MLMGTCVRACWPSIRSFIPKGLENVRSRYMDAPKRPMTPSEYERLVLMRHPPSGPGVRSMLDRRRHKAASAGPGSGVMRPRRRRGEQGGAEEEEEDDYSVASMKDPIGHDQAGDEAQQLQQAQVRRGEGWASRQVE